jgi:hypothetical protein
VAITVVSGLPRSGTSLMMQMLVAGGMAVLTDGARSADEDNPRGYFEYEAVKRTKRDASWVPLAVGKAVKVVYALLRDLPADHEYRVIMMRRDLSETIASQREMLRRSGRAGTDIGDPKLRDLFARELEKTSAWLREQPNFRVLEVEHRDCLKYPGEVAARANHFLGETLDEAAMAASIDPSLYRQRSIISEPRP